MIVVYIWTYFLGAVAYRNAWFGIGGGPILLSGLICSGSEHSLLDCYSSIPSSSCDHFDDAGVSCSSKKNNAYLFKFLIKYNVTHVLDRFQCVCYM